MSSYWLGVTALATLVSAPLYHYQARAFSETDWTSEWDGGPDHDSREYFASVAVGRQIAKRRQADAPFQAAGLFFVVMGIGAIEARRRQKRK